MSPNDYDRSKWMDMLNIAYRTRPEIPPIERKVSIEVSEDCLDNLAGLLGLLPETIESHDFTSDFSTQFIQKKLVTPDEVLKFIMKSTCMPWMCGNLSIQIVEGRGIFDIRFR